MLTTRLREKTMLKHLPKITKIEERTMDAWLANGVITLTDTGQENLYFVDQFGNEFYCKCYPRGELV